MEDFSSVLHALRPPVWKVLSSYLPHRHPSEHYRSVREYPLRQGKYFRPALVLLSASLHEGEESEALLTAAAMQASEEWLLIHDDLEDGSALRRGQPALQEMFGPEIALNAGDSLHVLMWRILGDNAEVLGSERGYAIWRLMSEILLTTTEGQFLELAWRKRGPATIKERDYMELARRKSAAYTVSGPIKLGAMVARTNAKKIAGISLWGDPWGVAFQIADDLLGLEMGERGVGKVALEDIAEGKISLVLIHLLDKANKGDRRKLLEIYSLPRVERAKSAAEVLALMVEYGSLEHARGRAEKLLCLSKLRFAAAYPRGMAADRMIAAMDFAVHRRH